MTVHELIRKLMEFDGSLRVMVSGHESGLNSKMSISQKRVDVFNKDKGDWFFGDYAEIGYGRTDDEANGFDAICIERIT